MTVDDLTQVITSRRDKLKEHHEKIDDFYKATERMFIAVENGTCIDKCFEYWVTLIDKMENFSDKDKDYYNYHATNLVALVEDWYKARAPKTGE